MSALEALAGSKPATWSRRPGNCIAARLGQANETLRRLIEETDHPATHISRDAAEDGITISDGSIAKHRRRVCGCAA